MNTKQLTLAIVLVAAAATLVLAPSLTGTVLAKKTHHCTVGQSSTSCNEHNQSTPAAHNKCTNPTGKEVNCHGNVS
jgi:hypothetical protein